MSALAHPHGWIDLGVRVITDEEGRATGLHQTWRMDPFYSLVVFDELRNVPGSSFEEGLDQLGGEIRNNLSTQHYLTEVTLDGAPLTFGDVTEYTAMEHNDRLTFMFILPFETPPPLEGKRLQYRVFDPTYYIEVVHEADHNVPRDDALVHHGEPSCELSIDLANPDPELVLQAALLDINDDGGTELGQFFAETGNVDCRTGE